jgi:hypothetical protein
MPMPRSPKRPGTVTVAAIILIVLGTLSLVCGVCGAGGTAVMALMPEGAAKGGPGQPPDPMAPQRFIAKEVPAYYPVIFASVGLDMMIGLGQLICGIGLLRMSSLSRLLAILLTLVKLVVSLAGHAFSFLLVFPAQSRFFEQNPPPANAPFDAAAFGQAFGMGFVVLTIVVQLVIVAVVVLLLSLKGTRDAFASAGSPEPEPEERRPTGYDDDDGYGARQ